MIFLKLSLTKPSLLKISALLTQHELGGCLWTSPHFPLGYRKKFSHCLPLSRRLIWCALPWRLVPELVGWVEWFYRDSFARCLGRLVKHLFLCSCSVLNTALRKGYLLEHHNKVGLHRLVWKVNRHLIQHNLRLNLKQIELTWVKLNSWSNSDNREPRYEINLRISGPLYIMVMLFVLMITTEIDSNIDWKGSKGSLKSLCFNRTKLLTEKSVTPDLNNLTLCTEWDKS